MNLQEKDHAFIWPPYSSLAGKDERLPIIKGEGSLLFDGGGKAYIDAISSWWVTLHGHAHPHIAKKVSGQLHTLEQVIFAGFTHEPAVSLAGRLLDILPGSMQKVFYSDNGSTAVEVALKMAIQYRRITGSKRTGLVAFENAYHGDTFGAMSVSGRGLFTRHFSEQLFDVRFIPAPVKGKEQESLQQLRDIHRENPVSAFIFEPLVQGASGMLMHEADELDKLMQFCRQEDILLIADEVMTGFGRTGTLFATQQISTAPDIICLSKGLTGGTLPMGVTACNEKILTAFSGEGPERTLYHGHSFTGSPLSCAAALASLDLLEEPSCMESIRRICKQQEEAAGRFSSHQQVENARSCGTIMAFDLKTRSGSGYLDPVRDIIINEALSQGVILRPLGNVIYVLPPYSTTGQQLETVYSAIDKILFKLRQQTA